MSCPHVLDPGKRAAVPCSQCAGVRVDRVPSPAPRMYTAQERARLDRIIGRRDDDAEATPRPRRRPQITAEQQRAWIVAGDTLAPVPRVPEHELRQRRKEIRQELLAARRRERERAEAAAAQANAPAAELAPVETLPVEATPADVAADEPTTAPEVSP